MNRPFHAALPVAGIGLLAARAAPPGDASKQTRAHAPTGSLLPSRDRAIGALREVDPDAIADSARTGNRNSGR